MTFKDVVVKNFFGNIKQYLSYFLCSTYTITIFFMYAVIMFNENVTTEADDFLGAVFPLAITAVSVFSVFFITYAHMTFVKGRNKEFGIYCSLGMDQKELKRMVHLENLLISAASLFSGMLIGTLFSRLFQMAIMSMMQIENMEYQLNYRAFLLTLIVFILIFGLVFAMTSIKMNRTDINSLLKDARQSEAKSSGKQNVVLGFAGIILIMVSAVLIKVITSYETLTTNPAMLLMFAAPAFLGIYLFLSYGLNALVQWMKASRFYFRHLLEITEIQYKYSTNKKIIFILSILSAMTIFFVASPFSLLRVVEQIADDGSHHLEYASVQDRNILSDSQVDEIIQESGAHVTNHQDVSFLYLYQSQENQAIENSRIVVSVSEYNAMTGKNLTVEKGQAINIHNNWIPGTFGIEPGKTYSLYAGSKAYSFQILTSGRGKWIAKMNTFPAASEFIINDEEYDEIYQEVTEHGEQTNQIATYHFYDFQHWKGEEKVVALFEEKLKDASLPINSILRTYEDLKNGYSVMLFVCSVLGILFFTAGGGVLYFKQFSELGEARKTFHRLFKIGITEKEMRKNIGHQLLFVFYSPLIFGSFVGIGLIYLMTYLVGGDYVVEEFMKNAWMVTGVYFVAQSVFYMITKKKYVSEVIKER